MVKIIDIEGIGPTYGAKLVEAGVKTTEGLLKRAASPAGRKELAQAIDVQERLVLEWVNRADLIRIRGVSTQYSDLLEAAGVDTVVELAQRNATNLHAALSEANDEKHLVRQLPTAKMVQAWVDHAKSLDRVVTH